MITIEKLTSARREEACSLSVKAGQEQFTVDNIREFLPTLPETKVPHIILDDDLVVGFFLFDAAYASEYDFCPEKSLGVRALLIDQRYQGRGIAGKAISQMGEFSQTNYPEFSALYLTVNCRNVAAYECYRKYGFEDTKQRYEGGPVGPQHIMRKCL